MERASAEAVLLSQVQRAQHSLLSLLSIAAEIATIALRLRHKKISRLFSYKQYTVVAGVGSPQGEEKACQTGLQM